MRKLEFSGLNAFSGLNEFSGLKRDYAAGAHAARFFKMTSAAKSRRPYPPDYVSAETLAYRLDCSETTVHNYVRDGILRQPIHIGNLTRWRWSDVEQRIAALEAGVEQSHADDPYFAGIERATKEASH